MQVREYQRKVKTLLLEIVAATAAGIATIAAATADPLSAAEAPTEVVQEDRGIHGTSVHQLGRNRKIFKKIRRPNRCRRDVRVAIRPSRN